MLRVKSIAILSEEDKVESDCEEGKHCLLRQCVRGLQVSTPEQSATRIFSSTAFVPLSCKYLIIPLVIASLNCQLETT